MRGLAIYNYDNDGLHLENNTTNNHLYCNILGTDAAGTSGIGNANGVQIFGASATDHVIGTNGDGTDDAAEGNVISGNGKNGVIVQLGTGNTIAGNWIGVAPDGTTPLGNTLRGIVMTNGATNHQIGGMGPNEGNLIAYNGGPGVFISSSAGTIQHTILGNRIFSNGGPGIDLDGVAGNDADDADEGANRGQNHPDIDGATLEENGDVMVTYSVDTHPDNATYPLRIDFYRADASGQGSEWIGMDDYTEDDYTEDDYNATVAAAKTNAAESKTITFTPASVSPALTESDQIVATATDADGNTSEFNATPTLLPVELLSFEAQADGRDVLLQWATASETNNAGFMVEQRRDAEPTETKAEEMPWEEVVWIEGAGTTEEAQSYTHRLSDLEPGRHVFRLKQIDYDGTFEYSPEVEVTVELAETFVLSAAYPNPFNPETSFRLAVARAQAVSITVYDALGRRVDVLFEDELAANTSRVFRWQARNRPSGLYFIRVVGEQFMETRRVTLLK